MDIYRQQRQWMVDEQIRSRGINDPRVIQVLLKVPRHLFVPPGLAVRAYDDTPLPLGLGQTISQPYMVALMTSLLEPREEETVLEIGTGSGYQAAVLALLANRVISVERIPSLAERARQNLARAGVTNVQVCTGDGSGGWGDRVLYSKIMVTAGAPRLPLQLASQLAEGGRMVIPIGPGAVQQLYLFEKRNGQLSGSGYTDCLFVKLKGRGGWE